MHYLLFYEVGEDYVSRRAEFRDAHLNLAWKASQRGELVLGGALADPVDGAVLLFRGGSPEVAERFAQADPYVTSGAVKRWYVRTWTTVAGELAETPVRPGEPTESSDPREESMIWRMWKARATAGGAGEYARHAAERVFPALRGIDGHRGAILLRRPMGDAIEIVVLTLWASMAAVRRFAGARTEAAVVDREAQAFLTSFDDKVTHFEVVQSTGVTPQ